MNPKWCACFRILAALLGVLASTHALAQTDTFRIDDMDLRDPHIFVNFLGCRDITDTPLVDFSVNGSFQASIQTDADEPPDGLLDLSTLIEFLPLEQSLPMNLMDSGSAACTAPLASTTCMGSIVPSGIAGLAALLSTGQCLAPIAGTVFPYTPAVTNSSAPCFSSPVGTFVLDFFGSPLLLHDAQIAATFVDSPATNLVNGLIKGFLTEADANNTILSASLPLFGGQALSALLPGGDPPGLNNTNCSAHNDKDINAEVSGWWFYLNFTATRVALIEFLFSDGFE